jgi:hypothetical protein
MLMEGRKQFSYSLRLVSGLFIVAYTISQLLDRLCQSHSVVVLTESFCEEGHCWKRSLVWRHPN